MSVKFVTESGKTTFEMEKGSTLVATLLSMYDGHDIPEIVTLSGSVGEVIDEEYEAFVELTTKTATPLSSVNRIIRILDVDEKLLRFAYADSKMKDRLHHYRFLGGVMNDDMRMIIGYILSSSRMGCCGSIIQAIDDVGDALLGCIYNACLMTYSDNFHLSMIHWDDFIELVSDEDCNVMILAALKLFAGRGDKDVTLSSLIDISTSPQSPSATFIYERLLDLFPEDIYSADFGLNELLAEQDRIYNNDDTNNALTILQTVHSYAVARARQSAYRRETSTLVSQDIARTYIGTKGLKRISTSLQHYLSKSWTYDAYIFRRAILSYLNEKE